MITEGANANGLNPAQTHTQRTLLPLANLFNDTANWCISRWPSHIACKAAIGHISQTGSDVPSPHFERNPTDLRMLWDDAKMLDAARVRTFAYVGELVAEALLQLDATTHALPSASWKRSLTYVHLGLPVTSLHADHPSARYWPNSRAFPLRPAPSWTRAFEGRMVFDDAVECGGRTWPSCLSEVGAPRSHVGDEQRFRAADLSQLTS